MTPAGTVALGDAGQRYRDLPPAPPPADHWPTRATMLADRHAALANLRRADLSMSHYLGVGALVSVAAVGIVLVSAVIGSAVDGGLNALAGMIIGGLLAAAGIVVPALGLTLALCRAVVVRRRMFAWEDLERTPQARSLPSGDLPTELATPFDTRESADFDRIAGNALIDLHLMQIEWRLIDRAMLSVVPLVLGFLFLLLSAGGAYTRVVRVGFLAGGLLIVATGILGMTKATRRGWRRSVQWRQTVAEVARWHAERALKDPTIAAPKAPGVPVIAMAALGVPAIGLMGVLVIRIAAASPIALSITAAIIIAVGAQFGTATLRSTRRAAKLRRDLPTAMAVAAVRTIPDPALPPPSADHPIGPLTNNAPKDGILLVYQDHLAVRANDGTSTSIPFSTLLGATFVPPGYPGAPATLDLLFPDGTHLALHTRHTKRLREALRTAAVRVI